MLKGDTPAQNKIKKEEFEKLCSLQCTITEICDWFNVEDDTLNSWCKATYNGKTFSEVFKIKRGIGRGVMVCSRQDCNMFVLIFICIRVKTKNLFILANKTLL